MFRRLIGTFIVSFLVCATAQAGVFTVSEFKGLARNPSADKIADGAHPKFDNYYVKDGNIRSVKGRDRLNSVAHADTTVKGFFFYEKSDGTKKLLVKETDEVVSYDTDGTSRTSLIGSLADETVDFVQIGDTVYFTSTTDGLHKWTGTGSATAVGSVAAPSSVTFTASTTAGGMTSGVEAICSVALGSVVSRDDGGGCSEVVPVSATATTNVSATSSTYQYKITKFNTKFGIESSASPSSSVGLTGAASCVVQRSDCFITKVPTTCATLISPASECTLGVILDVGGAFTSTTGTLAAAPSAPFNEYRIYRTVATGNEFFLAGEQDTGAVTDGKPDVSLATPLDTTIDTIAPPSFKYIESYKGVLFVAEGSQIRFTTLPVKAVTDADKYWLETDLINLSSIANITGMIGTYNSLLTFTDKEIFELTGFGAGSFRLNTLTQGTGAVSNNTIIKDTQGDVIFFGGVGGVFKLRTFQDPQDDLTGSVIDQARASFIRISSPDMDEIFRGTDSQIDLDPADYGSSYAYYDRDNDLYFLYIDEHCFIFDNQNKIWSHIPGVKMSASLYRKSAGEAGQGVLLDNLGFFYDNWTGYENGIESGTVTGNPTSSTATTLADTGASFNTTNDGLKGVWVVVDNGTTLQYRQVSSNTGTVITIGTAWDTNPLVADTYYVAHIIPDLLTKQYTAISPPKFTSVRAFDLVHEKSDSSQVMEFTYFKNKATTQTGSTTNIDLTTNFHDRKGSLDMGFWFQWGLRTFIYNTSNTINPPVDIISYGGLVDKKD